MYALKEWMRKASTEEQTVMARLAKTSRAYLYHLANPDSPYGVKPKVETAAAIERACATVSARSPNNLPVVDRGHLCETCARCPWKRGQG